MEAILNSLKLTFNRLFPNAIRDVRTENPRPEREVSNIQPVLVTAPGGLRQVVSSNISFSSAETGLSRAITTFRTDFQALQRFKPFDKNDVNFAKDYFLEHADILEGQLLPNSHYESQDFVSLVNNAASFFTLVLDTNAPNFEPYVDLLCTLKENCLCVHCGSTTAGPVQLGCQCEKSFCGECITSLFDEQQAQGTDSISCPNPECDSPRITKDAVRYNRDYDNNINEAMSKVRECPEKTAWIEKRNRFLASRNCSLGSTDATAADVTVVPGGDHITATALDPPMVAVNTEPLMLVEELSKVIQEPPTSEIVTVEDNNRKFLFYKQCLVIVSFAMLAFLKSRRAAHTH